MTHQAAAASDIIEPSNPLVLTNIYKPDINIVTWQRQLDDDMNAVVQTLFEQDGNFQIRVTGTLTGISQSLFTHLSHIDNSEILVADLVVLTDMFAELFELKKVGLRMSVLTKAMCPKFHVDHVPCRLVTTYLGAATEWLQNQYVERDGTGKISKTNDAHIQQLQAGDVTLLKGEAWQGNEGKGAVHRSPTASEETPRLVVTLDFA